MPPKRPRKEVTETSNEHEKSPSPVLDLTREGIKKTKVEQNQLQPAAALREAFTQVAGKVQKELRKESNAEHSQRHNNDYSKELRDKYKIPADFQTIEKNRFPTDPGMIDNTDSIKRLLYDRPDLLKKYQEINHNRIKYYLELGAANPAAPGYKDKKGNVKYAQLMLETAALSKGLSKGIFGQLGVKEAQGLYATKLHESGDKDSSNKAANHMKKWEKYGKSLENSEENGKLTNTQHSEIFDYRVKEASIKVGLCIVKHLTTENQHQEKFNQVREQLLKLTDVLNMNTTDIDTIIRETGHQYTHDIDKMISLASHHKNQKPENSYTDSPKVDSSSNIHSIHESLPETKNIPHPENEEDLDIDI